MQRDPAIDVPLPCLEPHLLPVVVLARLREGLPRDRLGFVGRLAGLPAYVAVTAAVAALAARRVGGPGRSFLRRRRARESFQHARVPPRGARIDPSAACADSAG